MNGDSARMIWKALTGLAGRVRASGNSIIKTVARQVGLSDLHINIFDRVDGPSCGDSILPSVFGIPERRVLIDI